MFKYEIEPGLELRLLEERHADELFALTDCSRDHLRPWIPWVDVTKSVEDSRGFIRHSLGQFSRGENIVTGIWYHGKLAGVISFDRISQASHSAMIGYWIGAEYHRKGLVTKACQALIDYGFGELGFNRICLGAATGNERSIAIPVRLGFTEEGVERQAQWLYDRYVDIVRYSILKDEWQAMKKNRQG